MPERRLIALRVSVRRMSARLTRFEDDDRGKQGNGAVHTMNDWTTWAFLWHNEWMICVHQDPRC